MKRKIRQAILIILFNLGWSAMLVFGFLQNAIY